MVLSEMTWAGPVRAALEARIVRAGDGDLLQLHHGRRQREIGGQPLAEREEERNPAAPARTRSP